MHQRSHCFRHANLTGLVFRIAEDQIIPSLHGLLFEQDRTADDRPISFAFSCAMVQRGSQHIMLDAGSSPAGTRSALSTVGLTPDEIDTVLISHQDFDHVGGLVTEEGRLTFSAARHLLPLSLWDAMADSAFLDTLPDRDANFLAALRRLLGDSVRCSETIEALPGITFLPAPGHRAGGHAAYEIATTASPLLYVGDAILHPTFIEDHRGPFQGDDLPLAGAASRAALIEQAQATRALVFGAHIPFPGLGTIDRVDGEPSWRPAASASSV